MPRNPRALLTSGRGVAALATVAAALSVPVVTHAGILPAHADTVPSDDLTNDGTTPGPAPAPEPGPGSFDDLTNDASAPAPGTGSTTVPDDLTDDGTTPPPAPAPEPGPGTPDDLTNDGTTPPPAPAPAPGTPGDDLSNDGTTPPPAPAPEPGPGTPDDLTNEGSAPPPATTPPATTPPAATPSSPAGATPAPTSIAGATSPAPKSSQKGTGSGSSSSHARLSFKVTSRMRATRRDLRKGLTVRLTAAERVKVVVTLRRPARAQVRLTLSPGSHRLVLRPRNTSRAVKGRKIALVVTATAADGRSTTLVRKIRVIG